MLSSSMLLLNLILLIDVTFSTPTGDYTNNRITGEMAILRQQCFKPVTGRTRVRVALALTNLYKWKNLRT